MIEATGKQIVRYLEMVTAEQLSHSLETIIEGGYWVDSVQRTSQLMFGSADYLVIYHPVNTVVSLAAAKRQEQP